MALNQVIYLDTNILVYLLENHPNYGMAIADTLRDRCDKGEALTSSTILITEFLAGSPGGSISNLRAVPTLSFYPVDETVAVRAAELQKKHALSIGDAIHLATAVEVGAKWFYTNDVRLAKIVKHYIEIMEIA